MSKFKIGDRVVVNYSGNYRPDVKNEKGLVIGIHGNEYTVKCDNEIETYDYCCFSGYESDKNDLIICADECLTELAPN